ncbi:GHMP kinase [Pseudonocardia xishanensis]|uniref:L-threonine kinase BluE n=1 Tax=Pseudonocardia xishanensis TaxID=630995 RepID=A0ABP8RNH4_9PSEU
MTGSGWCPCHHGELLQGAFRDRDGVLRAGLVTLPRPDLRVRARFEPGPEPVITVGPGHRPKATRAARLTVAALADRGAEWAGSGRGTAVAVPQRPGGGRVTLTGSVPFGLGMGSSTADVVATIRAVADGFGVRIAPREIARIAVAAEAASDPLMFDDPRPRLFAQRDGVVLEVLGESLPPLRIVGCLLDGGRPVDTPADAPPLPDPAAYAELRSRLRRAVSSADPTEVARVATASARLHRADSEIDRLLAAGEHALGVQVAHSGSVAGLLLRPDADPAPAVAALRAVGLPATGSFVVGELVAA